jgi:hypothetical protein
MASRIIMVWSLDELVLDIPQRNGNLCQRMGKLLMLQVRCSCSLVLAVLAAGTLLLLQPAEASFGG